MIVTKSVKHILLSGPLIALVSCGNTSVDMQQVIQEFENTRADSSSSLELIPISSDDNVYQYRFVADAQSEIWITDDPTDRLTVLTSDASATSSDGFYDIFCETWKVTVDPGAWEVRYEPGDALIARKPGPRVYFAKSRYFLNLNTSSRLTENALEVLVSAYAATADITEDQSTCAGNLRIDPEWVFSENAQIDVSISTINGDVSSLTLLDNGNIEQGDLLAGDGRYSAIIKLSTQDFYYFNTTMDAVVDGNRIQRNIIQFYPVTSARSRLTANTFAVVTDRVFDYVLTENEFAIPLIARFTGLEVLDDEIGNRFLVTAEIWAIDSTGEDIFVLGVDSSPFTSGPTIDPPPQPVDLGDGTYGLPLVVKVNRLPEESGQFESVRLRNISIRDRFGQTLLGSREVTITEWPGLSVR